MKSILVKHPKLKLFCYGGQQPWNPLASMTRCSGKVRFFPRRISSHQSNTLSKTVISMDASLRTSASRIRNPSHTLGWSWQQQLQTFFGTRSHKNKGTQYIIGKFIISRGLFTPWAMNPTTWRFGRHSWRRALDEHRFLGQRVLAWSKPSMSTLRIDWWVGTPACVDSIERTWRRSCKHRKALTLSRWILCASSTFTRSASEHVETLAVNLAHSSHLAVAWWYWKTGEPKIQK